MRLSRITVVFTLSGPQIQHDLLHEFSLHDDVVAVGDEIDDVLVIRVETSATAGAVWDVRATVGMFDDGATEITDQ